MPKRGNGGVPQQLDVDRFVDAIRGKPELRQKVIGELRESAHEQAGLQLGMVVAAISIFAIILGLGPNPSTSLAQGGSVESFVTFVASVVACLLVFFAVCTGVLTFVQGRTRHAISYLAAYEEGIQASRNGGSSTSPVPSSLLVGSASIGGDEN